MENNIETKEKLPVAFITSFVSDGWDKVGVLKEEIAAIKEAFSETEKAEQIIQGLIDAYLVSIGQMEQYLAEQTGVVVPETEISTEVTIEEPIQEEPVVEEALNEDVTINIEKVKIIKPEVKVSEEELPAAEAEIKEMPITLEEPERPTPEFLEEPVEDKSEVEKLADIEEAITEEFEYFTDFPEPVKETNIA